MSRALAAVVITAGCALMVGCADGSAAPPMSITVFAAASLNGTFTELGDAFAAAHPGATVRFSFGPSSGLAAAIVAGAPADVFAAAGDPPMGTVLDAGEASTATHFATNSMMIALPPANPGHIDSLADLADPNVKVSRCQVAVPCGAAATQVLQAAALTVTPVSEDVDVKGVLTRVTLGEVDAGLVYVTDVRAAGDKVIGIPIPSAVNATTSYPIAALTRAANPELAQQFVDFVRSAEGQRVLRAAGFQPPTQ